MKIAALDLGASNVDAVVFNGSRLFFSASIPVSQYSSAFINSLPSYDQLVSTGGKPLPSPRRPQTLLPHINEFEALAQGGLFLSRLKKAVIVSCGTGSAVVWAQNSKPVKHLGGTGVGGGTLQGLGQLLLHLSSPQDILSLAQTGNASKVNLTIKDIIGQSIGLLPETATAANFACLKSTAPQHLAAGLVTMIAETIGLTASLAAQSIPSKDIVFVGRLATHPLIRNILKQTLALFTLRPHFPAKARYTTALGAAIITLKTP